MKQKQAAMRALNISKSTLSRLISGKTKATDEQKRVLTEMLWKEAGACFEPEHTIRAMHNENMELRDTIKTRDDTIAVYDRGFRNELLVGIATVILCATILLVDYAPRWENIRLKKIYGYALQAERIKYLEMRVSDLELLVEKLDTLDNVKDARFNEIMDKITAIGGE